MSAIGAFPVSPLLASALLRANVQDGWKADVARRAESQHLCTMIKFLGVGISLVLLAFGANAKATLSGASQSCSMRWGKPVAPLVTKAETAKAIFLAVERDFFPQANKTRFPDLFARENGSTWRVYRGRADGWLMGGGQLAVQIAKCDGRVSDVYFSK
jgi:hypothetical protein